MLRSDSCTAAPRVHPVAPAQAHAVVRSTESGEFVMSDFLGRHDDLSSASGFQAYPVQQKAPVLRPHYHEVDQFQIVVAGTGKLGGHVAAAGTVHYSDAYTPYGPITTTEREGLSHFTLRLHPAIGINFMPESRNKRETRGGEHFTCQVAEALGTGLDLLAETRRGAQAWAMKLSAGSPLAPDALAPLHGRGYAVVLAGAVVLDERALPERTVIPFVDPGILGRMRTESGGTATLAVVTFSQRGGQHPPRSSRQGAGSRARSSVPGE